MDFDSGSDLIRLILFFFRLSVMSVRRGSTSVNLIVLLVAILLMGVGGYFYVSREQPYNYASTGNTLRFKIVGNARDCAKEEFNFSMTDKLDVYFKGTVWGTRGLIELDCGFDLRIEGMQPGLVKELPFTKDELVARLKEEIDDRFKEHNCDVEVLEISLPQLKGDTSKPADTGVAKDSNDESGPNDESGQAEEEDKTSSEGDEDSGTAGNGGEDTSGDGDEQDQQEDDGEKGGE